MVKESNDIPCFYLKDGGNRSGPYTFDELAVSIAAGNIRAHHEVTFEGANKWFPASALKSFPLLTPRYHDWLHCLLVSTDNVGAKGRALTFAIIPPCVIAVIFGLAVFPPGVYPRIVLAAPGLVITAAILYPFGFLVFKLPKPIAVGLCVLAGTAGIFAVMLLLSRLVM